METLIKLIEILEASVKKNGEVPLTNLHLLRICKMIEKAFESEENNLMGEGPDYD